MKPRTTTPPDRDVLLYDGHCGFCRRSVERVRLLIGPAAAVAIEFRSFHDEGALAAFPGVTAEHCERAMQLVRADGRVFSGAEAFVQLLRRRALGKLALAYYAPGLRQLADLVYDVIAKNRLRIGGSAACADGSCAVHAAEPSAEARHTDRIPR
ncbi:MAG: DUF393 domain-containing protein [Myxococcota bacterium]